MTWKKLKSKLVYENDWMQVREDDVINPGVTSYSRIRLLRFCRWTMRATHGWLGRAGTH
jgi:hypothetical protein